MEDKKLAPVPEKINIGYTKDKMYGIVFFEQAKNGGERLKAEEIRSKIKEKGIVVGIDEDVMNTICEDTRMYDYKYVIAKGVMPKRGTDAKIIYCFNMEELGKIKPKQKADGTVDFRELNAVHNVQKGEKLAVKICAGEGKSGINILGKTILAQKGKDVRMPKGKNTELAQGGLALLASVDGQLFYKAHNLNVSPNLLVSKDVDSTSGNIDFVGNVIVNGNVRSGYTIKAGGNVEVKGYVEAATIEAGGNVVVWGGIQGMEKGMIKSEGHVIIKFIQNASVYAENDIITETIVHSQLVSNSKIIADRGKGIIVGGSIAANTLIRANVIGSPMLTFTSIQVGVSEQYFKEFEVVREKYNKLKHELAQMDKSIIYLTRKLDIATMSQKKLDMFNKLKRNRMALSEAFEEVAHRQKKLSKRIKTGKQGIIKAKHVLHPGTRITLSNTSRDIKDTALYCSIRIVGEDIVLSSY